MKRQFKSHTGFSLVELLIASAIGLFLMGAIVQVFAQSRSTVSINQSVSEIQDRGRTLLHHLSFAIKQRGHQGCLPPMALNVNDVDTIDWANLAAVTPLANSLPNRPYTLTALRAYEVNATGNFLPAPTEQDMIDISQGTTGIQPRPLSDVIHVQYGDREGVDLWSNMNTELSEIEIPANSLDLEVGDLIMIGDCTAADIVAVTSLTTAAGVTSIGHAATNNRNARLTKPYETNAQVRRFHAYTYLVGDSGRNTNANVTIYSLFRIDHNQNSVELADGIDFLQLSYKSSTTLGVQDMIASDPGFNPMRVIGLDAGLLVVGLKDVLSDFDKKVYRLPGAAVGPGHQSTYDNSKMLKTPFRTYIDIKNRA